MAFRSSPNEIDFAPELEKAAFGAAMLDPDADKILDFGLINRAFLDSLAGAAPPIGSGRTMLPADYSWVDTSSTTARPRIPMALSEYLAYKSALAYDVDKSSLHKYFETAARPIYFDSTVKTQIADTQGCGFLHDGMVFIVMRGSESKKGDWLINTQSNLTGTLSSLGKFKRFRLRQKFGEGAERLIERLDRIPNRHLGFALGWECVYEEVVAWLDDPANGIPRDAPIVLSGHSLGGALAQIGADVLRREQRNVAAVITFGAPSVGNEAFKTEYDQSALGLRTVRFEAEGDCVPKILRRWYYRLGAGARDTLRSMFAMKSPNDPGGNFVMAGNMFLFDSQPPLSAGEIESAIHAIERAREEAKKEAEKRKKEEEKEKAKQQQLANDASRSPQPEAPPSTGTAAPGAAPQQSGATNTAPGQAGTGGNGQLAGYALVALFSLLFLLFVVLPIYLVVRSRLSSHAISDRYALYLSTLSYQRIRALQAAEPGSIGERLTRANTDLDHYLKFIRGSLGGAPSFKSLETLPVRLVPDLKFKFATYLSDSKNIV